MEISFLLLHEVVRCGLSLVTLPLLNLVKIHWIQWIQRKQFGENSINQIGTNWEVPLQFAITTKIN